jgi:hypothetical protein
MLDVIGFDSRSFIRKVRKKDNSKGKFESVLGVGVRANDYVAFDEEYGQVMEKVFKKYGIEKEFRYYCFNDIKDLPQCYNIIADFFKEIEPKICKVHIFYSLFSSKKIPEAKVYGRLARKEKIKLSSPTMTYRKLTSRHLVNVFPVICAWRLMENLNSSRTQFHMDAFMGHNFEAYEELMESDFSKFVFTSGDCINPVISAADLLIALIDYRLEKNKKLLIFENLRPVLPEFGKKVLAFPISNTHLPKITPIEKKPLLPYNSIKRPVYWFFKGDDLMDSGVLKRSKTYRNLLDIVACRGGCVKLFSKKDAENIRNGDMGVYMDSIGEEIINSYAKIGKKLIKEKLDLFIKNED